MSAARRKQLVLGLYPFTRGIAYAAFHAPLAPVDWGLSRLRGDKDTFSFAAAASLMERLDPDIVVLSDCTDRKSRPPSDLNALHLRIAAHAESRAIVVCWYSKADVLECFREVGAATRFEIASAIAERVDAFSYRLPPEPRPWNSQNQRLGLFDAAALVMTHFCKAKGRVGSK
jgi:hypothetical protein